MPGKAPNSSRRLSLDSTRRNLLKATGVGVTVGMAGCLGDNGDDDGGDPTEELPDVELLNEEGEQVEMTIYFDQGSDNGQQIATQMQEDLAEGLGIHLELEGVTNLIADHFGSEPLPDEDPEDFPYGPAGFNAGPPDRTQTVSDWDVLIGIAANGYPRTPDGTNVFWLEESGTNAYGYVPEVDMASLYDEFQTTRDPDERQDIADEIFGTLSEQLPANFLSVSEDFWVFANDINTDPEFNEFGYEGQTTSRYRDEQTVSGDFTFLTTNELGETFIPEVQDVASGRRHNLVTDYAYDIGTENEIIPLFMDIEDTGDSEVYVCTLRDNLQWGTDANGNSYGQMTAEDWVFQSEYVHGVADDAGDFWDEDLPPSGQLDSYGRIENIEQTGELEFQIELPGIDPDFPLRAVIWGAECLPKELYEEYAPDAEALRESPEVAEWTWTGNLGPYTFDERTPGVSGDFTAVRNDDYYMREHTEESNVQVMDDDWVDAPYFNSYRFDVEPEDSTVNERMRNLEGDTYEPPSDVIEEFRQDIDDARVETTPDVYVSMMFFNQRANGHPIAREQAGREAISTVIDKEVITEQILRGLAEPAHTHQPTWSEWYNEDAVNEVGVNITEDDIVAAREMLDELDGFEIEEL